MTRLDGSSERWMQWGTVYTTLHPVMNQPKSTFTRPRDFNAIGSKTQLGASFHNGRLCRFVLTCLTTVTLSLQPPASSAAEPTLVQRLTVVFASLPKGQLSANSSSAVQQLNRSQGAPRGASSGRADFAFVSQIEPSPLSKHTTDDASRRGWS